MSRRGLVLFGLVAGLGAGAATLGSLTARDPYLVHLEERIAALRPAVERELGAPIPGHIRVVVSTRAEIGELIHREFQDLIRAIEGADLGEKAEDPDKLARNGIPACVDREATIHVCREEVESRPYGDAFEDVVLRSIGKSEPLTAEVLDAVLVHELVHVYQFRALGLEAYCRGSRHMGDLFARRAVSEGHAVAVTTRVAGRDPSTAPDDAPAEREKAAALLDMYLTFEAAAWAGRVNFPYEQGRIFVESAIARLGRDAAVRRLFVEPPSLSQVVHPDTWPGTAPPDAGTDGMLRRARLWLATGWKKTDCYPLPTPLFLTLLGPASSGAREAAQANLIELQRIEAKGEVLRHAVLGHLLAARDESGARALQAAWIEAAQARDVLVPRNPKMAGGRVRESAWKQEAIDGVPVQVATRHYRSMTHVYESAVVARRGRYVLELRLAEDPGGVRAALRLARQLLACMVEFPDRGDPDDPAWDARWRFAGHPSSEVEPVRRLLGDSDPDVRLAALLNLLRRRALSSEERGRVRGDPDPLVRLTAWTWCASGEEPDPKDLLAAIGDPDPWVAASGWHAASAHIILRGIPGEAVGRALQSPEAIVRRSASRLLDLLNDESPEDLLALVRQAVADEDPGVREHGAKPLLGIPSGTAGLGEVYVGQLTGPDEDLRRDALINLSIRDGVPGTAIALLPFLEDAENVDLAMEAFTHLGTKGGVGAPKLRRIAEESANAGITSRRLGAIVALAAITGDRTEALAILRKYLASGTEEQACDAASAAGDLGAVADLLPELKVCLESKDRRVVLSVLSALEDAGRSAEPALPAILRLINSHDPSIRRRARNTDRHIRGVYGEEAKE